MRVIATVFTAVAVLVASAATSCAAVGWCGVQWPPDGATYTVDQDIEIYVQVWKEGVTDQPGQGADIAAALFHRCQGDPSYTEVAMLYNVDVGNNDEYMATIASGHGCGVVEFYCVITDLTDMEVCTPQNGGDDPPFFLTITGGTAQDVTVTFHLCLSGGVGTTGDICVTGSSEVLTNWGSGVALELECPAISPNVYTVDVLFAAGSNPSVEYKYRKDGCDTWEMGSNRNLTIDDSGPTMDLGIDSWESQTNDCPDCGAPVDVFTWGVIKALYR